MFIYSRSVYKYYASPPSYYSIMDEKAADNGVLCHCDRTMIVYHVRQTDGFSISFNDHWYSGEAEILISYILYLIFASSSSHICLFLFLQFPYLTYVSSSSYNFLLSHLTIRLDFPFPITLSASSTHICHFLVLNLPLSLLAFNRSSFFLFLFF